MSQRTLVSLSQKHLISLNVTLQQGGFVAQHDTLTTEVVSARSPEDDVYIWTRSKALQM